MKRQLNTETGELEEIPNRYVTAILTDPPVFKTPFNHNRDKESDSTALICKDPSRTQQQFLAETDINNILKKFLDTRDPTTLGITGAPQYRDIEREFDLQDQMVTAWDVEQAWLKLPVEARAILQTPTRFVEWYDKCLEEGNVQGLVDIGLIPKEKAAQATTAPGGDTPAPQAPKPATETPPPVT